MSSQIDPAKVFILVPVFNEGAVLRTVVDELVSQDYSVVVIDDGSSVLVKNTLQNVPVYLLRHTINLGQGAALQTGLDFALAQDASIVVTFDADGQHCVEDIKRMVDTLQEKKVDVVLGSRFIHANSNVPAKRKFLLQVARFVNFFFTGMLLTDAHNGLRAFTKKAAEKIKLQENRMAHATEVISVIKKNKFRIAEVPVTIHYTDYSKQKGQKLPDAFRVLFELFLNKLFR